MTDSDSTPSHCSALAPTLAPCPTNPALGFLSFLDESSGLVGGYLLTNAWGRPIEFRLSSAVQPTRVQQILYGPTLAEYLHGELLGKTLVEKATLKPGLIIADRLEALSLRDRLDVPVIAVQPKGEVPGDGWIAFPHGRSTSMLVMDARHAGDREQILARLELVDAAVDLAEPFARIREAVTESRKTGTVNRAA